ncbi:hypothetical protein GCM10027022_01010 [Alpinimonas psychrophila]|uniref:Uncharacterized protein n=1 Tax=Alpinimonas psychrophila TaxID=748908 RepID=A0A7W3PQ71_9MICO|nr:DUF6350 family protein [Alpinimonas psychrophila]MBA8829968.1 hypothetical protein [Alpinimonas psychrophila]
MNRSLVAMLAALEAFLAVAVGVGISLVPLSIMWAARLDLGLSWVVFWRASADIWMLGHGVDLVLTLDPKLVAAIALPGAEVPFALTLAPLTFALLTVLMGVRLGRKSAESGARFVGPVAGIATFAGLTILIALSSVHPNAMPNLWMAFFLPAAIFAGGVVIGTRGEIGHVGGRAERVQQRLVGWANAFPTHTRRVFLAAVAGGTAAAAAIVAVAALLLTVLLFANFPAIIRLYEGLQGGGGGGLVLTAAQLSFMPNFVAWVASWLIGPGFALGMGSSVSPLGTQLGPVPSLPILGALPVGDLSFGFIGLAVPVLAGLAVALFLRPKLVHMLGGLSYGRWLIVAACGIGVVGGLLLGILAWTSSGAAGPGRLVDVGPDPVAVGGWGMLELGIGALIGMLAPGLASSRRPSSR